MNIVTLYNKDELIVPIIREFNLKFYHGEDMEPDHVHLTMSYPRYDTSIYRGLLWDIGIDFLRYEDKLTDNEVEYEFVGDFYTYEFHNVYHAAVAMRLLYNMLFYSKFVREISHVEEYTESLRKRGVDI